MTHPASNFDTDMTQGQQRHLGKFATLIAALLLAACTAIAQPEPDISEGSPQYPLCDCQGVMSATQIANAFHDALTLSGDFDQQVPIVSKYLQLVNLDTANMPDDRLERLALGEGAFLTFQVDEASAYFSSLLDGDDLVSLHAWDRMMQITKRALGDDEKAWTMVQDFYQKFPPSEVNIRGRHQQITNFASDYIEAGENEKVVEIIIDEISTLPANAPYMSYGLLMTYNDAIQASPKKQQVRTLVETKVSALKTLQQAWQAAPALASDDPVLRGDMPDWYWRAQYIRPDESLRAGRERQLKGLIEGVEKWLADTS